MQTTTKQAQRSCLMVIDPATHTPEIDCFNLLASQSPTDTFYHLPALLGFDTFNKYPLEKVNRVIVLGSSCSPNDNLPWIKNLESYLSKIIAKKIPLFAICFGHQLIAKMFGGSVDFLHPNQNKELGWREIGFNQLGPLTPNINKGKLFCSHREGTRNCPKQDLAIWATSKDIKADEGYIYKHGPMWTLQAHPEATEIFLNNQKASSLGLNRESFSYGHKLLSKFLNQSFEA